MRTSVIAGLLLTSTAMVQAWAQALPAKSSTRLEAIVVTANRRGQNLQKVPVAVTSFSPKVLARAGVSNALGIAQVDPSVVVTAGSGINAPFIRGVGNPSATGLGNEASVPVYIDDVYYSRLNQAYLELADIDQVQVLKGPQGTLFGRNSSGGAILYTTREPGPKPDFEAKIGYSSFNTVRGSIYLSAPITNDLAASLSVAGQNQGEGWGKNVNTGADTGTRDFLNVRGKLVWRPTSTTKVTLSAFYAEAYGTQGITSGVARGTVAGSPPSASPSVPVYPTQNFYDSGQVSNNSSNLQGEGGALKLEQGLGFADFVNITSFRTAHEIYNTSGTAGNYFGAHYDLYQKDREFTQEAQLKSKPSSPISWVAGAYYLNQRTGYLPGVVTGDQLTQAGLSSETINGQQTINSYAGYGQATAPVFNDQTHITLGGRYSYDGVHGVGSSFVTIPGAGNFPAQAPYDKTYIFRKITYKVAIDHQFTKNMLGYFSYSRGYKSGTFNELPLDNAPTKPESVDAYEVGLKSELLDQRVRVNVALFRNDISNPQVETIINSGGSNFVALTNAQGARSQGVEINSDARITQALTAQLGLSYLDAHFTAFDDAPFFYPANGTPYGNLAPVSGDAAGKRLPQVPEWRVIGGATYNLDFDVGEVSLTGNFAYTGKFAWSPDNLYFQKAYTLVNSVIGFTPTDYPNWNIQVWGRNLLGEHYYTTILENQGPEGYTAAPGEPRSFGVELSMKL